MSLYIIKTNNSIYITFGNNEQEAKRNFLFEYPTEIAIEIKNIGSKVVEIEPSYDGY